MEPFQLPGSSQCHESLPMRIHMFSRYKLMSHFLSRRTTSGFWGFNGLDERQIIQTLREDVSGLEGSKEKQKNH